MEITQSRSEFWLKLFDDSDQFKIVTNPYTKSVIDISAHLFSFRSWLESKKGNYYIDLDRNSRDEVDRFVLWAECANTHIWLKLNKNIEPYFSGDELDLCIAADWNKGFGNVNRTDVGEAEYQWKYNNAQTKKNDNILANAVCRCFYFLNNIGTLKMITSIPAEQGKLSGKLSWKLAEFLSSKELLPFLTAELTCAKQQTKNLAISEKINMWNDIYSSNSVVFNKEIYGKNIVIVDDLYQSGVSIWSYAKYLKTLGVAKVYGLITVKAQRDSDNK